MNSRVVLFVVIAIIALCAFFVVSRNKTPNGVNPVEKQYDKATIAASNGKFDPSDISFTHQQNLLLSIHAQDADYVLEIPDLGLTQTLPKGHTTQVDLTGIGVGTTTYTCGPSCGGTITVEPDVDADQ